MKIELDSRLPGTNMIEAYSTEGIKIRETLYRDSVIVSPDRIIDNWQPRVFADLEQAHFTGIIELGPEIVLIGTGGRLMFPDEKLIEPMMHMGIGVEIMDTGAACRAYNFIAAEGRIVVAALLAIEA
jgi:uncharacterized protein